MLRCKKIVVLCFTAFCMALGGCGTSMAEKTETEVTFEEENPMVKQKSDNETLMGNITKKVEIGDITSRSTEAETGYPLEESPTNPELRTLSGEKISITTDGKVLVVELYNNSAANDLLSKLSLNYEISDYAGWDEKLIRLDSSDALSMDDYTGGDEPGIPEVGYYEPGNWIALYYGEIGYWSGKIPLGKISATCEEIHTLPVGSHVTIDIIGE